MTEQVSQNVAGVRQRTFAQAREARGRLAETAARVAAIMADANLSVQGRQRGVAHVLGENGVAIRGQVEDAGEALASERGLLEGRITEIRDVAAEDIRTRAAVLAPLLGEVREDPQVLLDLYRARFSDPVDRRLLEDLAEATIAIRADGGTLAYQWQALQGELAPLRPAEERQALADLDAIREIEGYAENVRRVVVTQLDGLQEGGLSMEEDIRLQMPIAAINEFESRYGLGSSDPGAAAAR